MKIQPHILQVNKYCNIFSFKADKKTAGLPTGNRRDLIPFLKHV